MPAKKIIALCGSTRSTSTNLNLIRAIDSLSETKFSIMIFQGLASLPHFNPDLDTDTPPSEIAEFRKQLRNADGVLICTPEYAMGVPGTLKNAIDWTVSSCEFSKKPVALITASSLGEKGHASLLETLKIIESNITDKTQLRISYAKTKISQAGVIIDELTKQEILSLLDSFNQLMKQPVL